MTSSPLELRRILGRREILALAFGAMVGWGWVVLAGEMIAQAGTVGSALAFVVGAVMVLFVGLTYAELTAALSRAGGELTFTFVGLGARAAFVCSWTLVLAYVAVCAFEAVALPTVLDYLVGDLGGKRLYRIAGWDVSWTWAAIGVAGSIAIGAVNYVGIRLATFVQTMATVTLLLVGVAFFVPGNARGDLGNLTPLFTDVGGFLSVVIMTPFFFIGFDVIPQIAEEINVPFKAIGRLIVVSILIALSWYALVQWTVGFTTPDDVRMAADLPTADAMSRVYGGDWAGRVLVVGGAMGIVTSWNAFFIGATRLLFAMGRGGMLPPVFARLHPRHESPVAAIVLVTVVTAVAPFFGRPALVWVADAGGLAAVVAYALVAVAFLRIRNRYPALERPYRLRSPRLVGGLAVVATAFFVLLYLPFSPSALVWPQEWAIIVAWAVLGVLMAVLVRARTGKMPAGEQARRILGPYVEKLDSR